jgi:hypothetical protein
MMEAVSTKARKKITIYLTHFLIKVIALDHRNKTARPPIITWDIRVKRW